MWVSPSSLIARCINGPYVQVLLIMLSHAFSDRRYVWLSAYRRHAKQDLTLSCATRKDLLSATNHTVRCPSPGAGKMLNNVIPPRHAPQTHRLLSRWSCGQWSLKTGGCCPPSKDGGQQPPVQTQVRVCSIHCIATDAHGPQYGPRVMVRNLHRLGLLTL